MGIMSDALYPVKVALFVCLVGFLMSSSTTRLYRGRAPRQSVWQFYVLPHMRQSWENMTSVSAGSQGSDVNFSFDEHLQSIKYI